MFHFYLTLRILFLRTYTPFFFCFIFCNDKLGLFYFNSFRMVSLFSKKGYNVRGAFISRYPTFETTKVFKELLNLKTIRYVSESAAEFSILQIVYLSATPWSYTLKYMAINLYINSCTYSESAYWIRVDFPLSTFKFNLRGITKGRQESIQAWLITMRRKIKVKWR